MHMAAPTVTEHELTVLDLTGDTKIIWNSDNEIEVENARQVFNTMRKEGYAAYSVKSLGKKDEIITEFDPDANKLIMAPPMVGG